MGPRWTLPRLERACRKVLKDRARLKLQKLPSSHSAGAEWVQGGLAHVTVDPHQVAILAGVVHELLHVVLQDGEDHFQRFDSGLTEVCIEALEVVMVKFVCDNGIRHAWWRREIDRKIGRKARSRR